VILPAPAAAFAVHQSLMPHIISTWARRSTAGFTPAASRRRRGSRATVARHYERFTTASKPMAGYRPVTMNEMAKGRTAHATHRSCRARHLGIATPQARSASSSAGAFWQGQCRRDHAVAVLANSSDAISRAARDGDPPLSGAKGDDLPARWRSSALSRQELLLKAAADQRPFSSMG